MLRRPASFANPTTKSRRVAPLTPRGITPTTNELGIHQSTKRARDRVNFVTRSCHGCFPRGCPKAPLDCETYQKWCHENLIKYVSSSVTSSRLEWLIFLSGPASILTNQSIIEKIVLLSVDLIKFSNFSETERRQVMFRESILK